MRSIRISVIAVVAGVIAVSAGTVGAYALAQDAPDEQAILVEDFSYPGADRILAERGIILIKGDGHILLADCAINLTGQIAVRSSLHDNGPICFKVIGSEGALSLSIPQVYSIKNDGTHKSEATITIDEGATSSKTQLHKTDWTPVNGGDGATLLDLKASS